jgi:hypothetical protein
MKKEGAAMKRAWPIITLLLSFAASTSAADEGDWPSELRVTVYLTDFGSEVRVNDADDLRGSDVELEDEFDLDETLEELRVDLRWRFKPKHLIDVAYYDISRTGQRVITRNLSIGDQEFSLGTDLDSELDFKVYKIAYAYSFSQSEVHDATLSVGLHAMDMGLSVRGMLLNQSVDRHSSDLSVPLPVVGTQYSRRLSERFTVNLDAEVFALEYDDVKGSLVDLNASLDWDITNRFGATLGYNFVDLTIKSDNSDFLGKLVYEYDAITVGVRFVF